MVNIIQSNKIKKEKRIKNIIKKEKSLRTREDNIEIAYYKLDNGKPISYEEYILLLSTNDEIWFLYNDTEYQVVHESEQIISMCSTRFERTQRILINCQKYSSLNELLEKFRIDGKTIKEIWNNVTF